MSAPPGPVTARRARLRSLLVTLGVLALGLAVAALLLVVAGLDPARALRAFVSGAFGDARRIHVTLLRATPLALTGLAVAVAFRAGLWNIGAEGQLLAGAIASVYAATRTPLGSGPLAPALVLLAGSLGGAVWGALPGLLRAARDVPEVIVTILLNFVAIECVSLVVQGPLREAAGLYPQTDAVPAAGQLAPLGPVPAGLALAVAAAVVLAWGLGRTKAGLALRAAGLDAGAARALGVPVPRVALLTLTLSGLLAGAAGACEVQGVTGRLYEGYAPGFGYTAIAVALLARLEPLLVIPAALLFGALAAGSERMEALAQVPGVLGSVVQGLVVLGSVVAWRRAAREAA